MQRLYSGLSVAFFFQNGISSPRTAAVFSLAVELKYSFII